jgi:hypothetical protein
MCTMHGSRSCSNKLPVYVKSATLKDALPKCPSLINFFNDKKIGSSTVNSQMKIF